MKRRRVVSLVLCFIMIFTLWQPVFADGDTLTWTGEAGDGSWHNAGNWDLGRVPGSGDKVVIPEETVVEVVYETEPVELDCAGDLWIESGGHLYLTGTSYLRSFDDYVFDIFGDGNITITGEGSELHLDEGYIEGEGTLTIDPGASLILDTGSVEDGAGIGWHLVNDGQVLVESGWLFLYGSGEGEGAFTIAEEASLIFEGTFNVGGDVINSGELYLWYNANVYFEGDYRQDNTGLTTINIDNSDEYGKLNIGGEANLDGTLVIDIYYYPAPGASFEVLTYGSRNGEFSEIIIDRDDVEFEVEYRENSLVLSVEADTEPPELISLIPESGATVPPNLDRLTMVFSEPVWGDWNKSGSVYNAETNSHVRWLNFSEYDDQNISGNGTDTITLYIPAGTFEMGKSYYIEIDEGALVDRGGNAFAGISGSSEWTFTVLNDTQPPTAPANLRYSSKTSTSITLQWDPSSDDYGPIGYDIYGKKNGEFALAGSTESTSFTVVKIGGSFLEPESEYTFKVVAVDGNGNESEPSDVLSVITDQRPNFIWYEKEIPPTSAIYFDIIYGAGKYVAVGTHGTILSSDDGVNWELDCIGDISDPQLRAVTFGNNRFVAVGGNDIYTKSPTDEEWTKIELTAGYADLNDVTCGKKKDGSGYIFVAVGSECVWWSEDGIDWNMGNRPGYTTYPYHFSGVAADEEGNFIAVGFREGDHGNRTLLIWKSSNGKGWSESLNVSTPGHFAGIAYGNGIFVACDSTSENRISRNVGDSWEIVPVSAGQTDLTFGDGLFLAAAGQTICFSDNQGYSWVLSKTFDDNVTSVNYCNQSFFATDSNGRIYQAVIEEITVPSAPMNLTAIPDDGQVTLTWTVPATDGGSPITAYQVSQDNGESWTDVGLDTSYTFTGLTNGTEYTFKVRAVNSEGPGEAASITAVPIMTYPPDAPQNFAATPGYRQAVLSWDPPASDGGTPIIKYQLSKDKGESWTDVHKDLTTYTFINLTNGVEYTFKVRAVNNKGPGAEASATAIPAAPVPSQKGIYAWGVNSYGQLGDGSLVNKDFPTHIGTNDDWADWTMISAGYRHTAALQADGSLWTWGSNSNGQLGIGSDELRMNHPVQVGSDTDWVAVDAGYDFTVALKADGSLWAWGYAMGGFEYGGFSIDWNVPTLVDNENKWIAVSAGSGHTVAIREDGTLWGWGFNARGELGSSGFDDYIDYTESPVQISSDRWIAVSAGDYFTIGLKEDGSLWAWGENDVGQLGNGSTENTSVPTRVGSEGDSWLAAETAPGSDHVVAIKADGSLWAWGGNEYGQLGRGYKDGVHQNPPPHPVPQQIGTDTDWVSVVAGMNLSAALKSDGSLWLWGIIGIDMEGANEPQRLEADGTWLGVACGSTYALAILQGGSTVPGAPQNFTAIPGDGQVTLSWTAPASDGGSAIIRYEVSSDGGDTWTSVGTSTTHTFTGLTNGTEYTFKVRAVNNVGYGYAASVTAVPVAAPSGDFAGGSGTEDSPYLISTVTHLDNVRNYLDKHFRLTADLELSDFTSGLGWEPFGTEEEPFTGTLDGAGHTISNLTIAHDSESMAAGLFAYTGETAEIRDLGLVSVSVSGSYNVGGLVGENYGKITGSYVIGNVTGFFGVGGLVGNNHGSISNSWAEGTVKDIDKVSGYYYGGLVGENANDSTISNCYANVTVNSPHSTTVGGLVGDNLGSITDSFAVGAVEAGTSAGGLVGSNSGYIEKCYATGNVVSKTIAGGLVAYNYRSINQSYATGNVSGKGQTGGLAGGNSGSIFNSYARGAVSGDEFIGGLVGFNIDSITNCYSTGAVSGKSYTGGLVGLNDTKSGSVINCYWDKETSGKSSSDGGTGKKTAEMKQQETYENWNFDALWGINTDNDGYPFLIWQVDENALTVPGVPRDFSATPGNGLMELSWIPPASDGGSEITHYEVFCDNEGTWVVADTNSSHTFTGLENGTMYTFKVRAVNSAGTGPEASLMATPEATVTKPSAPQNLSIDAGDEEALLRWEAPASDGGSAITHYEVSIDGIIWATAMSNNFHVFIDLINGVEYTFYVRAVNSVGAGPAASITATPATRPSAPQNLTATPGDGQVTLSWDAPASDGGAEITKYQVSIDVENWIDVDVDTTTYTFTGLTNGEEFTFYVRAVNRVGEGEWEIVTATPEAELVITHTINFYSNGSLYASRTVASGYALEDDWPDNPIRSGYSFRGWFTEENGSGTAYTRETNITEDVTLYAYWTYIGGSSGGGSTTTPSTPAEQEEIETETETTFQISISGNVGTIIIDEDPWQTAAEEDITITVPSASGVSTYSIDMSMSILSKTDDLGSLTISTDIGSITVQSNMLTDVAGAEGDKAQITFGLGDKSSLPEDVRDRIGDRPLIQLSLSIDGQQTSWNNPDAPVKVSIPYTPTEEELSNPESIVVWYIDGSGNVVTVPNGHYDPATGTVTFYTTHFSDFAVAYNKVSFKDVPEDAWYNKAVSFIAARGITEGTGNDHFSPELNLKRGEFLVLMMRAYGIAPDEKPTGNFSDAGNTYYTGYLAAAKRLGISAGVGNNRFAPEKEITRQEMFTMLYNALKVIGQLPKGDSGRTMFDFSDASEIASWAKEAMAHFVRTGTVSGSAGKLSPADTATRAEMAQLLHNLLAN